MLQYFIHDDDLCATTRGRLETQYVDAALGLFDTKSFLAARHACKSFGEDLMTVVVELVHPISRGYSHMVDYGDEKSIYLLAVYYVSSINFITKFKYINYIGEMVKSKLGYKYLMNCMINDRLDKMLITLPEEIRDVAYGMVDHLKRISHSSSYKALYILHDDNEGGVDYFRTVCRNYWRWVQTTKVAMPQSKSAPLPIYAS